MRSQPASLAATTAAFALLVTAGLSASAAASPSAVSSPVAAPPATGLSATRTAYTNPVSEPFGDTFADPSVIRAKDGFWYAYGTSDPLREGETTPHRIPIVRSADLVSWTFVRDAFTADTVPAWAAAGAGLWAPDIRYVEGQYRMYYVVTNTTIGPATDVNDNAIGMATAPTPTGPWTDSGAPVVGPRPGDGPDNYFWTFDPSVVTNTDGSQWMFYGSYYGGMFVQRLDDAGTTKVGDPTMVAIDNKFEGAYAVRHGGYWYLFASTANCCAGPTTGYSVQVGRSQSIKGPYVDRQGVPLNQSRAGGTPTLNQNGNAWIGAGHNAIATDLSGQSWIVYHAINRSDPYLDGTSGINQRPMLMDRLDWVGGWPAVRAGRGPSAGEQTGPATGGRWVTRFANGIPNRWDVTGHWTDQTDPQSGGYVRSTRAGTVVSATSGRSARLEADLRSARGAAYGLRVKSGTSTVRAVIDPAAGTLRVVQRRGGRLLASASSALPAGFDASRWHSVVLQVRNGTARASVSNARLGDPLAGASVHLVGGGRLEDGGAFASGAGVGLDNLSVLPAAKPVTHLVHEVVPNQRDRAATDSFNGSGLRPGWTWVRQDANAKVTGNQLVWPTEESDLTGASNNAGVLLRDAPKGSWTVQTKLHLDLGTDVVRNFQQAGLIAYVNDDLFTRFSHVAIWNTRQTEFGLEMPYAGTVSYGGTIVGPPAETTWLRLTHRVDPNNGEHEIRAWSSRDGHTWIKGGVWTLPRGEKIKIGLVSHGGKGATAKFDYFRVYR